MTLTTRVTALEKRIGLPDPNNADDLTTRVSKMQAAFNGVVGENVPGDTGGIVGDLRRRLDAVESGTPGVSIAAILEALQPEIDAKIAAGVASALRGIPAGNTDVVAALAALNIHVAQNHVTVGMPVDFSSSAGFQVGGEAAAAILGRSNTKGTDGQNPGEAHTSEIHISDGDGGMRLCQYGYYGPSGFIRNTTNRAYSVLAMDSVGDVCSSRVPVGETSDGGQNWYLSTNTGEKFVRVATFKPGWSLQLRESATQYAATETDVIAEAIK